MSESWYKLVADINKIKQLAVYIRKANINRNF